MERRLRGPLRPPRVAARGAWAALPVLAAAIATGCASWGIGAEPVEVRLVSVTPLPSTAFEHRVRIDLRLRNPNPRSYRIDGLRFVLDVNGRRLASGVSAETTTLPRLGEAVVPVTTSTSLFELVNQIVALAGQEQPRFEYLLRGKVFLAGAWGSLAFERRGTSDDLLPRASKPSSDPP